MSLIKNHAKVILFFVCIAAVITAMFLCINNAFANDEQDAATDGEKIEGEAIVCIKNSALYSNENSLNSSDSSFTIKEKLAEINMNEEEQQAMTNGNELNSLLENEADSDSGETATICLVSVDDIDSFCDNATDNDEIVWAQPNYVYTLDNVEDNQTNSVDDPSFSSQWYLNNTSGASIDAQTAWDAYPTATNQNVVAVIDSGVFYTHEDLADNMWTAGTEYSALTSLGGGKYGYNSVSSESSSDPLDSDSGHGTHCASEIAAATNNGIGIAGTTNNNSKIMACRAFYATSSGTVGSTATILKCFNYVTTAKSAGVNVNVISNSWGNGSTYGKYDYALTSMVVKCGKQGIVSCFAAGNESCNMDEYPARIQKTPYSMYVGACQNNGSHASSFSNYGQHTVDLYAPGVGNYACVNSASGYQSMNGTSMACPLVAGTAAYVAAMLTDKPSSATDAIKVASYVKGSVVKYSNLTNKCITGGVVNLANALNAIGDETNDYPVLNSAVFTKNSNGTVTATIDGAFLGSTTGTLTVDDSTTATINNWTDTSITATFSSSKQHLGKFAVTRSADNKVGQNWFEINTDDSGYETLTAPSVEYTDSNGNSYTSQSLDVLHTATTANNFYVISGASDAGIMVLEQYNYSTGNWTNIPTSGLTNFYSSGMAGFCSLASGDSEIYMLYASGTSSSFYMRLATYSETQNKFIYDVSLSSIATVGDMLCNYKGELYLAGNDEVYSHSRSKDVVSIYPNKDNNIKNSNVADFGSNYVSAGNMSVYDDKIVITDSSINCYRRQYYTTDTNVFNGPIVIENGSVTYLSGSIYTSSSLVDSSQFLESASIATSAGILSVGMTKNNATTSMRDNFLCAYSNSWSAETDVLFSAYKTKHIAATAHDGYIYVFANDGLNIDQVNFKRMKLSTISATAQDVDTLIERSNSTVPLTAISITPTTATLNVGDTATLTGSASPSNADISAIAWTSSNTSVATVSDGTVTAVGKGSATITATCTDPSTGKTITSNSSIISVGQLEGSVKLSASTASLLVDSSTNVTATTVSDAAPLAQSEDESIATCSLNGKTLTIKGASQGSTKITVSCVETTKYTAASASITVTVTRAQGKIQVSSSSESITTGSSTSVAATITSDATPSIKSNATNVATATYDSGKVTIKGVSEGTAIITISCAETTKYTAANTAINVTVSDPLLQDGTYYFGSSASVRQLIDVSGGSTANGANVQLYQANETNAQKWTVTNLGNNIVSIRNASSGRSLDVAGGSDKAGTNVWQYTYNDTNAQKWAVQKNSDGSYTFKSCINQNLVIDLSGGGTGNGTNVQIYTSNNSIAQKFYAYNLSPQIVSSGVVIADGYYAIQSAKNNSYCVDLDAGSSANGANIHLWSGTLNNNDNQCFKITRNTTDGFYTITNCNTGKALDVAGGCVLPSTNVQQYTSNGTNAQKWNAIEVSSGVYTFQNVGTGLVLDVAGGSMSNDANIQTYIANGTAAQQWKLVTNTYTRGRLDTLASECLSTIPDGTYTFSIASDGQFVIDVAGGSKDNGANVQLYSSNKSNAQKWKISHDAKGYVTITNIGSGKVLDVAGGTASAGTNVQQYASNSTWAQKWVVVPYSADSFRIVSALDDKLQLGTDTSSVGNGTNLKLVNNSNLNNNLFKFSATS